MKILRRKAVCEKLGGINDVTLWRITRDDPTFPVCIQINKRVVGWLEHEIALLSKLKCAVPRWPL